MSREHMSSADAAWLHMDRPTNLMVVHAVLWFDRPLDWARVERALGSPLVDEFPRFRQRAVESAVPFETPVWEDDPKFTLRSHLHRVALPAPGDRRALQELIADTMTLPLDHSQALWQVHLIDGYGSGSAMLFRVHHCVADGIALARVLLSLSDDPGDPGIEPKRDVTRGGGPLGDLAAPGAAALGAARQAASVILHESARALTHPSGAGDVAAAGRAELEALAKLLLMGKDAVTPLRGELSIPRRVAWSRPWALDEIRSLGHAFGATVNDILVTALAGAVRVYLERRQSLVDELRVIVPFNLRPLDEPLPRKLGNRFGLVFLPLPVGISARRERLDEIKRRMDAIKRSPEGAVMYGLLSAVGLTPAPVERSFVDQVAGGGTAVVTNIPGPTDILSFAGAPVGGAVVWAPCSGDVGMSVSIFSYAGELTVGIAADAGLIPDPQEIVDALESEMSSLAALKRPGAASVHGGT
jgi:diacylglycerol O-acyltransferase